MRFTNILILVFLLSAFAIGVASQDLNNNSIDLSIDKAAEVIENLSFEAQENSTLPNSKGLFKIMESGVKFAGVLGIETMRTGIYFGKDNPEYFTPEFIFKSVKLILILTIVSLLIQPAFYGIVFLMMGFMWLGNHIRDKKKGIKK